MERAKDAGDLPDHLTADGIVSYLNAVIQGFCIQAGAGATPEQLRGLVATTLELWPGR
jgi:hypothetical protein